MSLQIRRGLEVDRGAITFDEGEIFYVTDTNLVYVGDGITPGGILVSGAGGGFVVGPASAVNNNIALFDGITGELIKDSGAAISTDGTFASNSDAKIPTEKAVKAYADSLVVGLWDDRGNFDASVNAYPSSGGSGTAGAILKGDIWTVSVGGTLPTGLVVVAGDTVRALIDTPGNTQANWAIAENNIGYVPENVANKDATGGYAGLTLFKINFKNVANTFTSFFTNTNTAARTYTFQDRDGTIADDADINLANRLVLSFETGALNPLDSTTYYLSDVRISPNTTASNFSFNLGYAYVITDCKIGVGANTVSGTTESSTAQIRNITQATSSSIGSFTTDGSSTLIRSTTFNGLNISVAAGDSIAFQWDTPSWLVNPTSVVVFVQLTIKRV